MSPNERKPTTTAEDWQRRYEQQDTPWDSGRVDSELQLFGDWAEIEPGRAIELGCGTGTNSVYLAECGFDVTGIDFAPQAIERAVARAAEKTFAEPLHAPRFMLGDVTKLEAVEAPFDFLFDRACYHCLRRAGQLSGYLSTVRRLMPSGSRLLVIAGNSDDGTIGGPPKVTATELIGDFEKLCRIDRLCATNFQEPDGTQGPLGWSLLMTRR